MDLYVCCCKLIQNYAISLMGFLLIFVLHFQMRFPFMLYYKHFGGGD